MIGRTLHHYEILDRLGEGGMGEVYLARDTSLGRRVALKVLSPVKAADAALRTRFEREARLAASLNHPNIVTLHSVEEADGLSFITMELVDGKPLHELITENGVSLETFFALALPLTEAVQAAHEHGITHRDLKPGNVMVTRDRRVKILDFGLAKLHERAVEDGGGASPSPEPDTEAGLIEGTVPYMSPERLKGKQVGGGADVFSLGVVFYETLTGTRPFAQSAVELVVAIVRDPPPPVSATRASIPGKLDRLVASCLEKDPQDRPTAGELHERLREVHQEWTSGVTSTVDFPVPPLRPRSRGRLLAAAAVVVALLALGGFFVLRRGGEGGPEPVAEAVTRQRIVILPFENLGPPQDEYFAAGVSEEITSRLASVSGLGVISRNSAVQYARTDKTTPEIGAELAVDYVLEGTVRWDRTAEGASRVRVTPQLIRVADDTHLWSQRYDRVLEDIFEVQSEIAGQVIRQLDVTLFPRERRALQARATGDLQAYEAYLRGIDYSRRIAYSPAHGEQALENLETAVALDPGFALAHAEISKVHSMLYHFGHDRSGERREQAKRAVDRALALAPESPEIRLARGYYHYWVLRDFETALAELTRAEEGLPGHPEVLEARAYIERRRGRFEEARSLLEKALELNPRDARLARELGGTLFLLRRYDETLRYYDRAIAFAPDPLSAYQSKAYALWHAGDLAAARSVLEAMPRGDNPLSVWFWFWQRVYERRYREALEGLAGSPVESIQWTIVHVPVDLLRALAHGFLDEDEPAREAYESARVFLEEALLTSPGDARLHGALGLAYAGLGRAAEAVREGRRGAELLPVDSDAIFGIYRRIELALIHTRVGDHEAALDEIELALSVPAQLSVPLLAIDPQWDPLRGLARFEELGSP